jgi:prolyl 4-hydroxylase
VRQEILSEAPEIRLLHEFLSPGQRFALIEAARGRQKPASVITREGAEGLREDIRSTDMAPLSLDDPAAAPLLDLARRFGKDGTEVEQVQVLRYGPGDKYGEHHDCFATNSTRKCFLEQGQRTWTVLAYLSAPEEGGLTVFPRLEIGVLPIAGNVCVWKNVLPTGRIDWRLLHRAEPVTAGEKWAAVCWVRDPNWLK